MRLLVTGATGFIGAQVMQQAAATFPGAVVGLARRIATDGNGVPCLSVDLLDQTAVAKAIADVRPTHLLHLAWDVTPGAYWTSKSNITWLEASLRLFRLFAEAGGRRILACGTCAEYDWRDGIMREDETALRPGTGYGIAKDALRRMLAGFAPGLGVSWTWARMFWLYGPGERDGRLMSAIARALLAGDQVALSSGIQRRDYMHVTDAARALLAALSSEIEGAINIGTGDVVEVRQLAQGFANQLGRPDLLRMGERRDDPMEAPLVVADVGRLAAIGFKPAIDIKAGLVGTAAWWKAQTNKEPLA